MAGKTPEFLNNAFETGQGYLDFGDALGMQRERDAQEKLQQRYEQMHQNFLQYRPEHTQSRMNALNNQLGAFGPLNNLVQRMYGSGAGIDLAALGQNPMTAGAMAAGSSPPPAAGSDSGGGFSPDLSGLAPGTNYPGALAGGSAGAAIGGLAGDPILGGLAGGWLGSKIEWNPFRSSAPTHAAAGVNPGEYSTPGVAAGVDGNTTSPDDPNDPRYNTRRFSGFGKPWGR